MVKPLGTPSGVRTVTPSPASTAAQVPERLGLVKVRRHGRSPRFSNAAERKAHGASNSTSFSSSTGSGERFQIQTIGELIDFQFTAERVAHPVGMNAHQYDIVHVSLPSAALDK